MSEFVPINRTIHGDNAKLVELGRKMSELRAKKRVAEVFDRCDAISEEMDEVYEQMLRLNPTTLEGYRALALAIIERWHGDEIIRDESPEGDGIAALLSALTGRPSRPECLDPEDEPAA